MNKPKNPISLYAEATPNPNVMKFTANKILIDESNYEFNNRAEASNFPLVIELFGFPFIEKIFISKNFISITKKINNIDWSDIVLEMREFIRDYLISGKPIVNEYLKNRHTLKNNADNNLKNKQLTDIEKKIEELINEYIRPAVEQDGGFILLKQFKNGVVTVSLQGACSGCPSSQQTLKLGIEGLLKKMIPGKIKEVVADND